MTDWKGRGVSRRRGRAGLRFPLKGSASRSVDKIRRKRKGGARRSDKIAHRKPWETLDGPWEGRGGEETPLG